MSGASTYNSAEADQLEQLTDDLTMKEWDDVWDVYAARGYDSAALVAQRYKTAFRTRYKIVGDAIDQAIDRLRSAATSAAATSGDTAIADAIDVFGRSLTASQAPVAAQKWKKAGKPPLLFDQKKKKVFDAKKDYFAQRMGADQAK